jgi:hypothetical protein
MWSTAWERIKGSITNDDTELSRPQIQIYAFGPFSRSLFSLAGAKPGAIEIVDCSSVREEGAPSWPPESIAVVGMAVDFPGGSNNDEFWNTLDMGVNTVQPVSLARY